MSVGFSFTNTASADGSVHPRAIAPTRDYAKIMDEADKVVLTNKTCTLDQGEQLTYTCQKLDKVTSTMDLAHPMDVRSGVQYTVKLEEILRNTVSGTPVSDEPIVMYLTVRHQTSSNITGDIIDTVFKRLVGACYKTVVDGETATFTPRWEDLMRSALVPVEDLAAAT